MKEIIKTIEDTYFEYGNYNSGYDGFIIKTNKQEIKLGIEGGQCCCEQFGYFMTNDEVKDFIGAEVLDVTVTDEILNTEKFVETYDGGCMFINIVTNIGVLQFTAYNSHNGYYGHDAVVLSEQLNYSEVL
jgi:hypothetical protein